MTVSVLVMTPVRSFGELIQQALQETGIYRVTLVHESEQVLEQVRTGSFPVAVLDFDLDPNPTELITAIYSIDANLNIIAIKDEIEAGTSVMGGLQLTRLLESPFYLPNLMDELDEVTDGFQDLTGRDGTRDTASIFQSSLADERESPASRLGTAWLGDVQKAAYHLTQLTFESQAQASLITREAQLWAYAGQLPHPAAEELTKFVAQYGTEDNSSDFARFVRLDVTNREYMLYATGLGCGYVLALTFETDIPFSVIRAQANDMVKRLAAIQEDKQAVDGRVEVQQDKPVPILQPEPTAPNLLDVIDDDGLLDDYQDDWQPVDDLTEERLAFFEGILSTVDIPDPDGSPDLVGSFGTEEVESVSGVETLEVRGEQTNQAADIVSPDPTTTPSTGDDIPDYLVDVTLDEMEGEWEMDIPFLSEDEGVEDQPDDLLPDYLKDTRPTQVKPAGEQFQITQSYTKDFDPVNPALHHLTYACVLVPRLPKHHLVGELAVFLNQAAVQLCLAFGWRLEHLAIRPNYLHWVVVIQPATSPSHMVRKFREQVSKLIFTEFPMLALENPSRDFWAPGYLIVKGKDPLSHDVVEDFISKTRSRQGSIRNPSRNRYT